MIAVANNQINDRIEGSVALQRGVYISQGASWYQHIEHQRIARPATAPFPHNPIACVGCYEIIQLKSMLWFNIQKPNGITIECVHMYLEAKAILRFSTDCFWHQSNIQHNLARGQHAVSTTVAHARFAADRMVSKMNFSTQQHAPQRCLRMNGDEVKNAPQKSLPNLFRKCNLSLSLM